MAVLLMFFLGNTGSGQAVVISKISNQLENYNEWAELLVISDNTNMRKWTIKDNASSGNWQTAIEFNDIPFWEHLRAGTIIVLQFRNSVSCGPVITEDLNQDDGYIRIGLDNTAYFNRVDLLPLTCASQPMTLLGSSPEDIIQLSDASNTHVHAFGFRGHDTPWGLIPSPKFRTSSGIGNTVIAGVSNVTSISNYDITGTHAIGGLVGLAQDPTTQTFWQTTREPIMTSQTITPAIVGNTITLTWAAATDPYPADNLTGYIILRNTSPAFVDPVDGTTYANGDVLGTATVRAHISPSTTTTYIDNSVTCGIDY